MKVTVEEPLRPINRWVRQAIEHSGKTRSEIARELHNRGVSGTVDRSLPGKMASYRDVSAAEMFALSEITGYPPPNDIDGALVTADEEIVSFLRRIEGLPATAINPVLKMIRSFVADADDSPE